MGNLGEKKVWILYFNGCLICNTCFINSTILGSTLIFGFHINGINSSVFLCKIYYYVSFFFFTFSNYSYSWFYWSFINIISKCLAYFSLNVFISILIIFCSHLLIKVDIIQFGPSYFVCYYDISSFCSKFVSYSIFILTCFLCFIRMTTRKYFQLLRCLYVHDII